MVKRKYASPDMETVEVFCEELIAMSFSGTTGGVGDSETGDSFEDVIIDIVSSWD